MALPSLVLALIRPLGVTAIKIESISQVSYVPQPCVCAGEARFGKKHVCGRLLSLLKKHGVSKAGLSYTIGRESVAPL